jgi:hypothetical protein
VSMQVLNKHARDEIHRRTLAAVRSEIGSAATLIGHCMEFAWKGYKIIKDWPGAPRTIIQAGGAQWPRVPADLDDGVSPTHFAYEWDSDSELAQLFHLGIVPVMRRADGYVAPSLPEMHVWLACPDTGEVIDFTTRLWPAACEATLGMPWLAPHPPEYLWTFGTRLPEGVNYRASREAIDCVVRLLRQQGRQYP